MWVPARAVSLWSQASAFIVSPASLRLCRGLVDSPSPDSAELPPVLVVRVGNRACAIPIEHVGETMRPLPIEPVAGMPVFVRGVAVIRGIPTPVIDLGALLSGTLSPQVPRRLVTLKLKGRQAAVGVDAVVGLRAIARDGLASPPPMLQGVSSEAVEAIGSRDAQLLLVLQAAKLVPEPVWAAMEATR